MHKHVNMLEPLPCGKCYIDVHSYCNHHDNDEQYIYAEYNIRPASGCTAHSCQVNVQELARWQADLARSAAGSDDHEFVLVLASFSSI